MSDPPEEPRPYHHGDLSRALVDAARALLEAQGASALSLRAVARAAGVSPAAPYHHFKDKAELLAAVGHQGWMMLSAALAAAKDQAVPGEALTEIGVAYVAFARAHPALYRVMYDRARDQGALPDQPSGGEDTYGDIRATLVAAGADQASVRDLELSIAGAWSAAHGLAELAGFAQFDALKHDLGGEQPFLRAVIEHMGLFPKVGGQ